MKEQKWCEEEKEDTVVDARRGNRDLSAESHRLFNALPVQESGKWDCRAVAMPVPDGGPLSYLLL